MKSARKFLIFSIILSLYLTACTESSNNANSQNGNLNQTSNTKNTNQSPASDDIEELELTVKLPFHPESAEWRTEPVAKPTGDNRTASPSEKKLTAVLKFSADDANKIAAQAETHKPAAAASISTENWFPDELTALSQMSGDKTLKGKTYAANDFYQAPFLDGKITRIEGTNYFILELITK
jgi:hypothetical protein